LRALGLESPERAVLRIITAIFGVAAVWYFTEDHTTANLILRIVSTTAVLALFPVVYWYKMVSVPAKLAAEANETIGELTLKLDDREQRREIQTALGRFIEEGQEILVACGRVGRDPPSAEIENWDKDVQQFIRDNMTPIYFSRFRNWADIPKEESGIKSEPHDALWQSMRARLARLHQYAEKIEQPEQ
jgi:hypothetical protein